MDGAPFEEDEFERTRTLRSGRFAREIRHQIHRYIYEVNRFQQLISSLSLLMTFFLQ